jgi:hypothetical protein
VRNTSVSAGFGPRLVVRRGFRDRNAAHVAGRWGDGGESGIRYLNALLESVSYRFQVAARPIFAIRSTDHCTLLHAGPVPADGVSHGSRDCHGYRTTRFRGGHGFETGFNAIPRPIRQRGNCCRLPREPRTLRAVGTSASSGQPQHRYDH